MMNMDLAAMYGTPGGPTEEDQEKVAQAELFAKIAADAGLDLNQYNDEQLAELWEQTFGKEAQEKCEKCGKAECSCPAAGGSEEEKKAEAAQAEFAERQEFQEKVAEMDYLGRLMAHAYVNELGEIGENMEKDAVRGAAKAKLLRAGKAVGRAAEVSPAQAARSVGAAGRKAGKGVMEHLERLGRRTSYAVKGVGRGTPTKAEALQRFTGKRKAQAIGAGLYAGGAAAAGGAGAAAASKRKQGSAIDELAANLAIEKAAEANYDADEAFELINSLYTLGGPEEGEKLAAAQTVDEAVDIRSLEYLDAAGYPVEWNQTEQQ
jgi:hypothetical protein